jgi:DNA-binding response OmpR family regulator
VHAKGVVLAVRHDDEREAIAELLTQQGLEVHHAHTAKDVVHAIEDFHVQLLVTDVQLPDMHAWMLLRKIDEIKPEPQVSLIVLSDEAVAAPLRNVKLVIRPVALATLKQIVRDWGESAT